MCLYYLLCVVSLVVQSSHHVIICQNTFSVFFSLRFSFLVMIRLLVFSVLVMC